MSNNFLCPRCRGYLNVGGKLVFSIKGKSPKRGLVFLSPEIGNYEVLTHPHFELIEGDKTEIFCPICHRNLKYTKTLNFARIIMLDEDMNEYELLFSRIVGEKSTFKIMGGEISKFGKHSNRYSDFFKSARSSHPYQNL
jgi:hypothetical protein